MIKKNGRKKTKQNWNEYIIKSLYPLDFGFGIPLHT